MYVCRNILALISPFFQPARTATAPSILRGTSSSMASFPSRNDGNSSVPGPSFIRSPLRLLTRQEDRDGVHCYKTVGHGAAIEVRQRVEMLAGRATREPLSEGSDPFQQIWPRDAAQQPVAAEVLHNPVEMLLHG